MKIKPFKGKLAHGFSRKNNENHEIRNKIENIVA